MGVRASYHTRTMHQHFSASVPHRCDCATTSSLIFEAVMRATSFLHPTTMIQALSAHRGAHTEKIVRIYLGLTGWEHTTQSRLGGLLQPSSLRVVRADREHGTTDNVGRAMLQVAASPDRPSELSGAAKLAITATGQKMNNLSIKRPT